MKTDSAKVAEHLITQREIKHLIGGRTLNKYRGKSNT